MRARGLDSITKEDLDVLRRGWGWYLALGIVLAVLGVLALGSTLATTMISIMALGWALVIGGVLQLGHAFWRRKWSGFFLDLAAGALYAVVGVMTVAHPAGSAIALTLLIAALLFVSGVFRIATALSTRYPNRGWLVVHGILSIVLGAIIWAQWPVSGLWVLGLFVGIELVLSGATLVALALLGRRLSRRVEELRPPPREERAVPAGAEPAI